MIKRNDMTNDPTHFDYIIYYEEMTNDDYIFILNTIGELKNRIKCGFKRYTTRTGKDGVSPIYTYKELHCGFDIETSTMYTVNLIDGIQDFYSCMYVAQFAVDNIGIRFRRWDDIRAFFIKFAKLLKLKKNEVICVFVHNLDYETSYIKHRFNIDGNTYFGKSKRKPIKFLAEGHIFFHDSYSITNSSLEYLAKMYGTKHQKTKDDIDHTKIRNNLTPITRKEERYIFNDVFILTDFARIIFEKYDFVPDTATQILSKKVNNAALKYGGEFVGNTVWEKWKNKTPSDYSMLKKLHGYIFGYDYMICGCKHHVNGLVNPDMFTPADGDGVPPPVDGLKSGNKTIYDFYEWLFRGGIAKSNVRYTSSPNYMHYGVQARVGGVDYTSSYPFVMTAFNYPISPFKEWSGDIYSLNLRYDHDDFEKYRYIFIIRFVNIKATNDFCIESKSKVQGINIIEDNGRVYSADEMTACLTDCDFALYLKYYKWNREKTEIIKMWRADAGKLPDYLLYPMWDSGRAKQELKHVKGRETEYGIAKAEYNSYYGLTCKQAVYSNYYYDNVVTEHGYITTETEIQNFNGNKEDVKHIVEKDLENIYRLPLEKIDSKTFLDNVQSFILSPFWGIYTSSFARFNLLTLIFEIGENSDSYDIGNGETVKTNDVIYCDTDSAYYLHPEKHAHIINKWNKWAYQRVKSRLPTEYHKALGTLGQLDNIALDETDGYADTFINFKTLGSKRYIKEYQTANGKKIKATVAGMPKGTLERFCKRNHKDIYKVFTDLFDFTVHSEDLTTQDKIKLGHKYHDNLMVFYVDDGKNAVKMCELSSCTLYPITFTLKMSELYLAHIEYINETIQGGKHAEIHQ